MHRSERVLSKHIVLEKGSMQSDAGRAGTAAWDPSGSLFVLFPCLLLEEHIQRDVTSHTALSKTPLKNANEQHISVVCIFKAENRS